MVGWVWMAKRDGGGCCLAENRAPQSSCSWDGVCILLPVSGGLSCALPLVGSLQRRGEERSLGE